MNYNLRHTESSQIIISNKMRSTLRANKYIARRILSNKQLMLLTTFFCITTFNVVRSFLVDSDAVDFLGEFYIKKKKTNTNKPFKCDQLPNSKKKCKKKDINGTKVKDLCPRSCKITKKEVGHLCKTDSSCLRLVQAKLNTHMRNLFC